MRSSTNQNSGEIKARIVEMLTDLSALFRGEVETKTYRAYAPKLCDIPLEVLQEALNKCGDELRFFPVVAEIRERAATIRAEKAKANCDNDWEKLTAAEVCPDCFNTGTVVVRDEAGNAKGARNCTH
jgi:hypothetical protein